MKLIAKKPCSFGGKKFFIGEEVPADIVASPESQEKLGVLAIGKDGSGEMAASAAAELKETATGAYDGVITIFVGGEDDGEMPAIPVTEGEIQQVFSVMQMNADEGAKAISGVESENVLILLHAADSRKTIKDAARKQACNLFPAEGDSGKAGTNNVGTNADGADI